MTEAFYFYGTFKEAIKKLPAELQLEFYDKLTDYGLYGIEPVFENSLVQIIFEQMKFAIDNQRSKKEKLSENGKKGGAPKGNLNAKTTKNNQKQPITSKEIFACYEQPKTSNFTEEEIEIEKEKEREVEKEREKETETERESANACVCVSSEAEFFLKLWQNAKTKDGLNVFQPLARIEKPKDWAEYWQTSPPTVEQIQNAIKNFVAGLENGTIERRFIPKTPDRFILGGAISRYQSPVKPPTQGSNGDVLPADRIKL